MLFFENSKRLTFFGDKSAILIDLYFIINNLKLNFP